jgi:hypothetical protein
MKQKNMKNRIELTVKIMQDQVRLGQSRVNAYKAAEYKVWAIKHPQEAKTEALKKRAKEAEERQKWIQKMEASGARRIPGTDIFESRPVVECKSKRDRLNAYHRAYIMGQAKANEIARDRGISQNEAYYTHEYDQWYEENIPQIKNVK